MGGTLNLPGYGTLDDTSTIMAALHSGANVVIGAPGVSYVVNFTGTQLHDGFNERYCLTVPDNTLFDQNGCLLVQANGANSSVVMNSNVAGGSVNCGVVNGKIDCNAENQTDTTGSSSAVFFANVKKPHLEALDFLDNRRFGSRVLSCDGGRFVGLRAFGGMGFGHSFGIGTEEVTNSLFDDIYAENIMATWGDDDQGNGIIVCLIDCVSGKLVQVGCAGSLKVQDTSARNTFGQLVARLGTTLNCGVKFEGSGAGMTVTDNIVGQIITSGNFGPGLTAFDVKGLQWGLATSTGDATGGQTAAVTANSSAYDIQGACTRIRNAGSEGMSWNGHGGALGAVSIMNSGQTTGGQANLGLEDSSPINSNTQIGQLTLGDDQASPTRAYNIVVKGGSSNVSIASLQEIGSTFAGGGQSIRNDASVPIVITTHQTAAAF